MRQHGSMAAMSSELRGALEPIVADVRRGLRDLDPLEVPTTLRRVVASADRRLPPPLLQSLMTELDGNEWLRTRLLNEVGDRIAPETAAFLERGPGWWVGVVERALAAAAPNQDTNVDAEIADLRTQATVARQRLRELNTERDELRTELAAARRELRRRPGSGDVAETISRLESDRVRLEESLTAESERRRLAEERVATLLKRRERPQPMTAPHHPPPAPRRLAETRALGGLGDPVDVARRLDLEAAALAAGLRRSAVVSGSPRGDAPGAPENAEETLRLPIGISPDSPEAMSWLLSAAAPATVVVDGYNVTYLLDPDRFATAEARDRLVALLGRMRRIAGGRHDVVVVFDSGEDDAGPPEMRRGIEVRFTSGGTADDAIVDLARTKAGPVVVITKDRELRERVEREGALALWGDAIAAWSAG